jgi:hypothetical protein
VLVRRHALRVATRERRKRTVSRGFQVLGPRDRDAREHREPERAAIMNEVFTTPDASPASLGSTSPIAASSTGLKAVPAPRPSRIMLGSTSTTKLPSTGARAKSRSPSAATPRPAASGSQMPKRMTSRAEIPIENAIVTRLPGRKASPTSSGL